MARRTVAEDIHYIDQMFAIPEGLAGYVYGERLDDDDLENVDGEGVSGNGDDTSGVDSDVTLIVEENLWYGFEGKPQTPDNLIIVDQQLRTTSTGNQVVDLLVEIPDAQPMVEFEFKVAKVI